MDAFHLPKELQHIVFQYYGSLTLDDIKRFRLVCRRWLKHSGTLSYRYGAEFGTIYFVPKVVKLFPNLMELYLVDADHKILLLQREVHFSDASCVSGLSHLTSLRVATEHSILSYPSTLRRLEIWKELQAETIPAAQLYRLTQLTRLEHLEFLDCTLSLDALMSTCQHLQLLTSLSVAVHASGVVAGAIYLAAWSSTPRGFFLPNLRSLSLHARGVHWQYPWQLSREDVQHLATLSRLRSLSLSSSDQMEPVIAANADIGLLTQLTRFHFPRVFLPTERLTALTKLEEIVTTPNHRVDCNLTQSMLLPVLQSLSSHLTSLRILNGTLWEVNATALQILSFFPYLEQISEKYGNFDLSIFGAPSLQKLKRLEVTVPEQSIHLLSQLRHLQELVLSSPELTDRSSLWCISLLTSLTQLDLARNCTLDHSGLSKIVSNCLNLRSLKFTYPHSSSAGFPIFSRLTALEHLTLQLSGTITDDDLHRGISSLSRLQDLNVFYDGLTGVFLAGVAFERSLTHLAVHHESFSMEGVNALAKLKSLISYPWYSSFTVDMHRQILSSVPFRKVYARNFDREHIPLLLCCTQMNHLHIVDLSAPPDHTDIARLHTVLPKLRLVTVTRRDAQPGSVYNMLTWQKDKGATCLLM